MSKKSDPKVVVKKVLLRMPGELMGLLKDISAQTGKSVNSVIIDALKITVKDDENVR